MAKEKPEYTVVARRYRPQQFSDLIGQEAVAQALRNALSSDRVAHAYLFTGARGVGKTSTARILAKTEVQKVPITILSRCQRFDFGNISAERIAQQLRAVVAGEKLKADDEALELIARRAGGSMRDAQSLLDQLLAFGGERLSAELVHQLLGTAPDERVIALASAVLEHDAAGALELLGKAADEGLQLGELLEQLLDYWRDLMVANSEGGHYPHLNLPVRYHETLASQAAALNLDTILAGLDVLSMTKARLRGSGHPRVLLEMALVRLSRLDDLVSVAQLAQMLNERVGSAGASGDARSSAATPP